MGKRIGQVVIALNEGAMAKRPLWPEGDFIFCQVPATIPRSVVPGMQSLPQAVKDEFERRFEDEAQQIDAIYYAHQIAYVNSSNLIVGYSPSIEDLQAEDWIIHNI
ncbi:MAG: MW1434 family type I TA system toxin [Bacteroidota bacterium]